MAGCCEHGNLFWEGKLLVNEEMLAYQEGLCSMQLAALLVVSTNSNIVCNQQLGMCIPVATINIAWTAGSRPLQPASSPDIATR
jgi:hypothetical protein